MMMMISPKRLAQRRVAFKWQCIAIAIVCSVSCCDTRDIQVVIQIGLNYTTTLSYDT